MRVHRRQLPCRCHTCFRLRKSRAKPEQSCCSFPAISSILEDGFAEKADVKPGRPGNLRFQFTIPGFESSRPSQPVRRSEKVPLILAERPLMAGFCELTTTLPAPILGILSRK